VRSITNHESMVTQQKCLFLFSIKAPAKSKPEPSAHTLQAIGAPDSDRWTATIQGKEVVEAWVIFGQWRW